MKTTFLYCQFCSNKFLLDENVIELKVNDVPGGVPFIDKEDGRIKVPSDFPRRRIFRCVKCGRGVASKILTTPPQDLKIIK